MNEGQERIKRTKRKKVQLFLSKVKLIRSLAYNIGSKKHTANVRGMNALLGVLFLHCCSWCNFRRSR